MNWFSKLLRKEENKPKSASDERASQLEYEELMKKFEDLKSQLRHSKSGEESRTAEAVKSRFESLFLDAATPVTQVLTLGYLLETEGKPVQAGDVLSAAKRLVRSLEDAGMKLEGEVGVTMAFNPNLHEPLSSEESITPGQQVVVRFVGVSHNGKVLRKAGVERIKD